MGVAQNKRHPIPHWQLPCFVNFSFFLSCVSENSWIKTRVDNRILDGGVIWKVRKDVGGGFFLDSFCGIKCMCVLFYSCIVCENRSTTSTIQHNNFPFFQITFSQPIQPLKPHIAILKALLYFVRWEINKMAAPDNLTFVLIFRVLEREPWS